MSVIDQKGILKVNAHSLISSLQDSYKLKDQLIAIILQKYSVIINPQWIMLSWLLSQWNWWKSQLLISLYKTRVRISTCTYTQHFFKEGLLIYIVLFGFWKHELWNYTHHCLMLHTYELILSNFYLYSVNKCKLGRFDG